MEISKKTQNHKLGVKKIMDLEKAARSLYDALISVKGIGPLTEAMPALGTAEAYQIQMVNLKRMLAEGHRVVGKKIGLTSLGMQRLLNVYEPDYGTLMEDMLVENGGNIDISRMISPKVECEIAFVLKKDLSGPVVLDSDVVDAVSYITPAFEIVDSRIKDWKIKLPDTIADNASAGKLVLSGNAFELRDFDLANLGMYNTKNGELCNSACGVEVMGNPVRAVTWLANKLIGFDMPLKAGEIILSGAFAAAIEAKKGDRFAACFDRMGKVEVQFI
jgi:2-keto-4-pentenoate hydratase